MPHAFAVVAAGGPFMRLPKNVSHPHHPCPFARLLLAGKVMGVRPCICFGGWGGRRTHPPTPASPLWGWPSSSHGWGGWPWAHPPTSSYSSPLRGCHRWGGWHSAHPPTSSMCPPLRGGRSSPHWGGVSLVWNKVPYPPLPDSHLAGAEGTDKTKGQSPPAPPSEASRP